MYLSHLFMLSLGCVLTLGGSPGEASINLVRRIGDSRSKSGTPNDDDPYPGPDVMYYKLSDFTGNGCPNGTVGAWYGWMAIHKGSGVWVGGAQVQATMGPNISTAENFKSCRFDFELGAYGWQFRVRPSAKWITRKVRGHLALDNGVIAEYTERVFNNGAEDVALSKISFTGPTSREYVTYATYPEELSYAACGLGHLTIERTLAVRSNLANASGTISLNMTDDDVTPFMDVQWRWCGGSKY